MARAQAFLRQNPRDVEGGLMTSFTAILYAAIGRWREAEDAIRRASAIGQNYGHFHHSEHNIASAYALMGEHGRAIEWLRKAWIEGMPCFPLLAQDPNLNPLRHDPAFVAFMRQSKAEWRAKYAGL